MSWRGKRRIALFTLCLCSLCIYTLSEQPPEPLQPCFARGSVASKFIFFMDIWAGVAKVTAALVRMGQLPLIRDTVAVACEGGRADVVAAVTMALLALREICIVTQINNALVSAGQLAAGAKITGV